MRKQNNNRLNSIGKKLSSILVILVFLFGLLTTATLAAIEGHGVSGLTVNAEDQSENSSYKAANWGVGTGSLSWSDTTKKTGLFTKTYHYKKTQLTLSNDSGATKTLSFNYTMTLNGGTVMIDGNKVTANGSFAKTLDAGDKLIITVQTQDGGEYTTTINLTGIILDIQQVEMTFAPAANGSYTVDGAAITQSTTKKNPSTTSYNLVATPAVNYVFDAWYVGNTVYSTAQNLPAASFAENGTITARFKPDPLFNQATVPAGSAYSKDDLVSISSQYYHDTTDKLEPDGSFPSNNSAYSKLAQSQTKDKIDVQYVPSLQWSDNMGVTYSASAKGDYVVDYAEESFSYARMCSDVIRIYAKENCNISFNYTNDMALSYNSILEVSVSKEKTNNVYTYITTSDKATVAQVKSGTALTGGSGSSGTIALSKGNYLYILAETYVKDRFLANAGTTNFKYDASISNFTVSYNEKKDILTAGFRDNIGKVLGSGQIVVNNTWYGIGANGNMTDMSFADLASVNLSVGSVPANYVHIGWEITPKGGSTIYQYTTTYSRTLTEDVTVNALFVPKTTITMGTGKYGYEDATYKDFNGNTLTGQYVARNAAGTAYYTTLKQAFESTDVVVLLAGSTIIGDWTIPDDYTFVIPFAPDDNQKGYEKDTGSTTPVMGYGMGADYCLVNLNGNLNVEGTLIVNSRQNQTTGAPGGNAGHLVVPSGKTITVSGALYAYGPVTGEGKVETTSAAEIHETMEFSDNTVVIYIYNIYEARNSKQTFPFNTMFINSIEIPVTYQKGATLTAHAAVKYDTVSLAEIPIIAPSGALMNHMSGTITKYYDKDAGQFVFKFDEDSVASTGAFSISMEVTVIGQTKPITMNSEDYYLPLSAPFRYEVAGSLTINGKYKCLPGMTIDVKEGGTLTIADGSEVVLYRANDYDYRGKHGGSTDQWGYSERAYPVNPQRFNGGSYPFAFDSSNMGSAKLNVDGNLIVNGGLYVTEELISESSQGVKDYTVPVLDANGDVVLDAEGNEVTQTIKRAEINKEYFALDPNGYNILTGTGKIDMTNADIGLTEINEVMRAAGTNDLAWDAVSVVPLKGLRLKTEQYESLSGISHGVIMANGLNIWCNHDFVETRSDCNKGCETLAPAAWIKSSGATTYYGTLADAVSKYNSGDGYIQMQTESIESTVGAADETKRKTIYLDLNGKDITLTNFYVSTLYGMDTATNGFDSNTADKYGEIIGTVTGTVAPDYRYDLTSDVVGKCYVKSTTGNLSFHRFDMGVTGYTFYGSGNTGSIVFNMVFKGDSLAKAEIFKRGVCLNSTYNWSDSTADTLTGGIDGITGTGFTTPFTVKAAVMLSDANDADTSDNPVFTGDKYFADGISFKSAMEYVYKNVTLSEEMKANLVNFAAANGFALSN